MRIHHVVSSVEPSYGGPSVCVPALCDGLAALGHSVTLHTYAPAPREPSLVGRSYRLRVYHSAPRLRKLGLSWDMPLGLRSAAERGEIMHVNGMWMLSSLLPAAAVLGTGCKLVVSPHGMLEPWALAQNARQKRVFWKLIQGPAVSSAALLHATADTERASLRALGLDVPIAVIPNAVDIPDAVEVAHFSGRPRTLLFLSRLHPKKGVDLLLRAWARVQVDVPEWRLQIVGPDNDGYLPVLRELARELSLARVEFCPPAYAAEKNARFRDAQLYVLPTHSENFGLGVAEALGHGVPAIVGHGAPWAVLEREHAGFHVKNDVDSLARALREALALGPQTLREMGARGRALVMREFSREQTALAFEDCYEWLHREGPAPACVDLGRA